jgi:phage regulator Rha-like protein
MSNIVKKNNDLIPLSMQEVEDRIAVIRNQEVIADADVAYLYGVETREVNQAVKNNPEKFPAHYMFELTPCELRDLKSKVLISNVSNNSRRGATKAFTERGLYMLATVLKGERARQVTFTIIETFFKVRELKRELLDLHKETDKQKSDIPAIALRKIVLRLLTKVTECNWSNKTSNIQKLINNSSKSDKFQIFFVSLPTK